MCVGKCGRKYLTVKPLANDMILIVTSRCVYNKNVQFHEVNKFDTVR